MEWSQISYLYTLETSIGLDLTRNRFSLTLENNESTRDSVTKGYGVFLDHSICVSSDVYKSAVKSNV